MSESKSGRSSCGHLDSMIFDGSYWWKSERGEQVLTRVKECPFCKPSPKAEAVACDGMHHPDTSCEYCIKLQGEPEKPSRDTCANCGHLVSDHERSKCANCSCQYCQTQSPPEPPNSSHSGEIAARGDISACLEAEAKIKAQEKQIAALKAQLEAVPYVMQADEKIALGRIGQLEAELQNCRDRIKELEGGK